MILYTRHKQDENLRHNIIPTVFALYNETTIEIFRQIIQKLKNRTQKFHNIKTIFCDLKKMTVSVLTSEFPGAFLKCNWQYYTNVSIPKSIYVYNAYKCSIYT